MDSHELLLGGFWFLRDLLVSSIISLFSLRYIKKTNLTILIFLVTSIILTYLNIHPFELLGRILLDSAFLVTGYQIRTIIADLEKKEYLLPLCFLIVALGSIISPASLAFFRWWQIIHFYVCAIAGSIMVLLVSKRLASISVTKLKNSLVYIGNHTMTILIWHLLCFKIVSLAIIKLKSYSFLRLAEFPTIAEASNFWLLYAIIGITVPLGFSLISSNIHTLAIHRR